MHVGKALNDCGIIETWDAHDLVMRRREITTLSLDDGCIA
jgi:hypothetical protein